MNKATSILRLSSLLVSAVLAGALALGGCGGGKRVPAEPEKPPGTDLTEESVADLLARLRERRAATLESLRASASVALESPKLDGRKVFRATLIAQPPLALRFRVEGHGPIGELFQIIQVSDILTVFLTRERQVFAGPVDSLDESAGIMKRLHPMRILHGLTAYEELLRVAPEGRWERAGSRGVRLTAPAGYPGIAEASFVLDEPTLDLLYVYLYREADQKGLEAAVVYEGWTEREGVFLPDELNVSIPEDQTVITLKKLDYLVNPKLSAQAFLPPSGLPIYPLAQLVFVEPEELEAQGEEEAAAGQPR